MKNIEQTKFELPEPIEEPELEDPLPYPDSDGIAAARERANREGAKE